MRRLSQSLAGRIIMGLVMGFISLSFAVWGVGNIFVGYGAGTVAEVGGTEIPVEAFRQRYQTMLQNLQQEQRRSITNEQARAMGLDQQVLGQMIGDALLDNRVRQLGLAMSNAEAVQRIQADPTFAGPDGRFDPTKFSELMRENGLTEAGFRDMQRALYLRREIADSVAGDAFVPNASLAAVHRFRDETRSIDYFNLSATSVGDIPAPDEKTLQTWFDARKQNFRAPEYRRLVTLAVTPTLLADPSKVSDEDARALYDRVKAQRFATPARRQVEQVVFPSEAAAREASDKVRAGATLPDVAKQANLPVADLGEVRKQDLFDPAIANAVFSLPEDGVSEPVKGQFGYVLIHVKKATPESVKPFDEVKDELRKEVAVDRARKTVDTIRDKIEDDRTSGKPLTEAAADAGLKVTTIDAIDAEGRDKSGKEVEGLVERDALLKAAFASDIGVDNDTLNTKDGGFIWFEVAGIDPAHDQTLAEVKDKATAAWRQDETARLLSEKAASLVARIDGGEKIEDVAKSVGATVANANDVKRIGTTSVPPAVVLASFATAVDRAGSAANGVDRIVFRVLDSSTPPLDPDTDVMKAVATQLKQAYSEDMLAEYMARLRGEAGVKINQTALNAAIGLDAGGQ